MLSITQMKKIALEECIKMIGKNLVESHKDLCCCSYSTKEKEPFSFCLGLDTKKGSYVMGKETPMEFYACVVVNPKTGEVTRDYKNSILPN